MNGLLFDTETTGLVDPRIIEAAWLPTPSPTAPRYEYLIEQQQYNPGRLIDPGAMAVHHILDEDVADKPPASEFRLPEATEYLIGHHVDFDWQAIGAPPVKRICTHALAHWLWPTGVDSYSLGALLYRLIPNRRETRSLLIRRAHSAQGDVEALSRLLDVMLAELGARGRVITEWEQLWQYSEVARVPTHMPFGKHQGLPIAQVPRDYKSWLLGQPDVDPYLREALAG